ncbi:MULTISPECIES: phosphotransferase [unclassified Polaromonas]|jgi:aminoglycoside phosphotransferase (APT) family kinase protein|uniref:phosphotransferase n=1 Tax=unclassified Polaromonas TaxID=2638319 RepID=UPI000BDD6802|nr:MULTISPECIES: phosphotransferase [unclassified Polaromonas]OYY37397.1 MAG: phosphotransferase family protein [Polaromonas sp. 35-63-35]OYZ21580.1 MAG: phosphotransferase family protein [Polaromonas sp. 16-63-31]OYZ77723.1 MAG: phosphotransferase family protein [Polaromonas sp. 24-63-21]OZA49949.1 MAG: phosphotransferase family protein [Polaromonas sp. 17-63-33]OZA87060.1 MAG: phosphotransferase family protein [Polaromonas sp. 39-63-25]
MSNFDHFLGTRAVSGQHAFDMEALSAYLEKHLPGFQGPLSAEIFKGGQSNPTYKLITPQRSYVMRAKPGPVAKLLPSAHAVEREFKVMTGLQGTDVPVAKMYCLCEDEAVIGRAFYVMEFVEGRVLWDQALPGMTNAQRGDIYREMNRVIAALHKVKFAERGLADYGKPGNYFERQIGRWSKQYTASITEPIPEMDALMKWLPENIPASARDESMVSIVHGDFRLDNLMFHPTEPRVLAVLDWELSTLGHPLADFSYHCMAWHIPPGAFRGIGGLDVASLGIPTEAEYIRLYCERTGFASPELIKADWNFYLAYNLFRLAAILQGIAKRVEAGTAASAQAVASAKGAPALARMAWDFAQKSQSGHKPG